MNPRKLFPAIFLLLTTFVFSEGTQTWQQKTYEDFSRGTARGIAIRSDGTLTLAPSFTAVQTSPSTFIWSIVSQADGTVYIGTGSPARVYRILPNGDTSVIFEPKELQVQALVLDKSGDLYAATSPDGKVYKISRRESQATNPKDKKNKPASGAVADRVSTSDPDYSVSTFFDPKTKYIWALAFDPAGRLYVGTGDHGEIFRVTKSGEGSVFFKSDESHIRTLAVDAGGNLIAGSDGSGLVYRISPSGEGFVLYSAPKKEITALALDAAGNIYVSGVGEKRGGNSGGVIIPALAFTPPGAPLVPFPSGAGGLGQSSMASGSDVYVLAPDGSPKRLWTTKDDIIYALGFDSSGRLLVGTGNKGRIVALEANGVYTDLVKASANQVTGFAPAPKGGIFIATSNLGKVFRLSPAPETEGVFESDVFDAHIFSRWGRADVRGTGDFQFFTRSGNVDNPDRNWSPWKPVDLSKDAKIDAPPARFIQWKIVVPARSHAELQSVQLNYRSKNVAPVIDEVAVQSGARFNSPATPRPANETVSVNLGSQQPNPTAPRFEAPMTAQRDHGSIAVRWSAHDDNDDDLLYSLYYKGDGESRWKLLKDKIADKFYSWDASLLPDGGYSIRVVASDLPSHSPDEALTDSKESARFEVDSTPPRIDGLNARFEAGMLHVTFSSRDTFSPIKRAEFSIDAGDWQFVEPVGQLSDSLAENYDFNTPAPRALPSDRLDKPSSRPVTGGAAEPPLGTQSGEPVLISNEHVVVVRVYDRFDNMGIAKFVVK